MTTVSSGFAPITVDDDFRICLEDGSYGVLLSDTYGDGWNGNVIQLWTIDTDGALVEYFSTTLENGDYAVVQLDVGDGSFDDLLVVPIQLQLTQIRMHSGMMVHVLMKEQSVQPL